MLVQRLDRPVEKQFVTACRIQHDSLSTGARHLHLHIIARAQAKLLGMKRYYPAETCIRGNHSERLVSTGACLCQDCKAFYAANVKAKHEANPTARSERERGYRQKDPAKYKARAKAKYQRTRQQVIEKQQARYWADPAAFAEKNKAYQTKNAERISLQRKAKYAASADEVCAARAAYYEQNRAAIRLRHKAYREANMHIFSTLNAKRRATLLQRMPTWFGEFDEFVIAEAFDLARLRKAATGFAWHVDHMIPLRAKVASGLHCGMNIQVIPEVLNLRKRNRMILTEPDDWLGMLR